MMVAQMAVMTVAMTAVLLVVRMVETKVVQMALMTAEKLAGLWAASLVQMSVVL